MINKVRSGCEKFPSRATTRGERRALHHQAASAKKES